MKILELFSQFEPNQKVFIYGYGIAGRWLAENLPKQITLSGFIDTDHKKSGVTHFGVNAYTPDQARKVLDSNSIIINTVIDIQDVKDILKRFNIKNVYALGMYLSDLNIKEFINNTGESDEFLEYSLEAVRVCHEGYYSEDKLFLRSVDLVITEKCSLKCKDCSNLMQYYEEPKNISFEEIVKDFDDLTAKVSHIFEIRLIGGEPFMNKDIYKILEYLFSKSNFSKVVVYSNAMIPIKENHADLLKDKRLVFSLTNYGDLAKNTPKVVQQLDRLGISYRLHKPENWTDSGVIHDFKRSQNGLEKIFEDCCGKNLITLSMGKIYRCPFAANADRLKAIPSNELNFVTLDKDSPEKIKKYTREIKYLPACNYCKGRSFDAPAIVPAIQAQQPLNYIKFD